MKFTHESVRAILARRSGRAPVTIAAHHSLERDLGLTPLGLVLVALDVEDLRGGRVAMEELEHVETVGDLVRAIGDASPRRKSGYVLRVFTSSGTATKRSATRP